MSEWKLIADAPMDGTEILGAWSYNKKWRIGVFKYMPRAGWLSLPGTWKYDIEYWQPLPEPPK